MGQKQTGLLDQLYDLHNLAVQNGLYDAADWLGAKLEAMRKRKSLEDQIRELIEENKRLSLKCDDLRRQYNEWADYAAKLEAELDAALDKKSSS